ncbi:MAG: PqqD family protein [Candidatus Methanofastidiosia archaeon]|jgi:hypothetical protein
MKVKQNSIVLFNIIKKHEYGLLNPLTKKLHRINESGRFIWEACKEAKSADELTSMVAEHFHIPKETAQKDVNEFIDRMVSFGLFEEC